MSPQVLLTACTELLQQVLPFEHPAEAVLARYLREHREFGSRDRAVLAEALFRVLRHRLHLEHLAAGVSGPKLRRLATLALAGRIEVVGQALGAGSWSPLSDSLAAALPTAEREWLATCEATPLARLPAPCHHNLPAWLAQALQAELADEADFQALAASLLQQAPVDLRVNALKGKRPQAQEELAQGAIKTVATPYSPWGLRLSGRTALQGLALYERGAVEVQDEGSQLLALLLDARRGEMVADFCAGAGGKTLALGAAMRDTGRLYAFDTSAHRLEALKPRLARAGLSNVHPAVIAHEHDVRLDRLAGKLDRVLVDAPCSGLGTLRRSPDLKWRQSPQDVTTAAARQRAILGAAARLVKPGGRLLYATCSLLRGENEAVAQAFDEARGAARSGGRFEPLDVADLLAGLNVAHAPTLAAGGPSGRRYLRLWPHRHGTDGFFAAAWQRN